MSPAASRPTPETGAPIPRPRGDRYFEQPREDLVTALPAKLGRVLDVGCGRGAAARGLRRKGATAIVGIEPDPEAAARARERYDEVYEGTIESYLEAGPQHRFDAVLCYDVLEHLVDPFGAVRSLGGIANRSALLHVSVPNARHISLLGDLALRGTFGYKAWGVQDVTHLRWFTRRDIVDTLTHAGWNVTSVEHAPLTPKRARATELSGGRLAEFLAKQWYVQCRWP